MIDDVTDGVRRRASRGSKERRRSTSWRRSTSTCSASAERSRCSRRSSARWRRRTRSATQGERSTRRRRRVDGRARGASARSLSRTSARGSSRRERLDLTEVDRAAASRPRPPRDAGVGAAGGRVHRTRLPDRRGSGGRDRLPQLRGAQHADEPSGAQRVRHVVHGLQADGTRAAAHAHLAGADPRDAGRWSRRSTS